MTTPVLADILLGQWQQSPRLRGVVADVLQPILADALAAADEIQRMQDIDQAVGVWLDYIGVRLGIERPATSDASMDTRWGFDLAGAGFDQHPFRGDAANDAVYPLPDAIYRRFVKARAVTVLSDGTSATYVKAVRLIDPNATVADNRDMTITVTTAFQSLLELADGIGALPRTAGVMVIYA